MDKINYNQHDWNKGEVIKEENLDNMENGIKQATDKINEIIDTEQDFKDRMADIDGRIDINNEELVIARDGCDNLGQRIERDQQYIYNILNDGSYLEFNGTDITVDNSKEGYTKDTIIKGQTYQNLIINANEIKNKTYTGNSTQQMYPYKVLRKANTVYTIIAYVSKNTLDSSFSFVSWGRTKDGMPVTIANGITGLIKKSFTTNDNVDEDYFIEVWRENTTGEITIDYMILLEGDWTDKEVPSEITGIESVGEKENNKISILSRGRNLLNLKNLEVKTPIPSNVIINENEIIANNYTGTWCSIDLYKKLKPNTKYFISYIYDRNDNDGLDYRSVRICLNKSDSNRDICYNGGFKNSKRNIYQNWFFTTDSTGDALFVFYIASNRQANNINVKISEIMLVETDTATEYEPYKEINKEILLPIEGGLKSLPNGVCDTIEQREDGVYLVQRVGFVKLQGNENWNLISVDTGANTKYFFTSIHNLKESCESGLTNLFGEYTKAQGDSVNNSEDEGIALYVDDMLEYGNLRIRISNDKLSTKDVEGFKTWLQANPLTVYYELATPIETKLDIDTLNLEVFKDVTYVTSNNSIKPTLSFKAPVDVNQTIADLQGEQEQLIGTYNTLKEENKAVKTAISELNEQEDVQTADMLDLDMRVLALEEGLE